MTGPREPQAVLFACSLNSLRSPIAAAFARHYFGRRLFVESVGVETGTLDGFAVAVMGEEGIDISGHKPRDFGALDEAGFDLIITLSPEAHHRALELTRTVAVEVEYWPTEDPSLSQELGRGREAILASYRRVRDALRERVLARLGPGGQGPSG